MKKVVILLPTYNEKDNLERFVKEVFEEEKNIRGWVFEVLIVDSHSVDGTLDIARSLEKKNKRVHVLVVGRGLGVAFIEGHKYAIKKFKPDALAQMDADGQVGVEVLPKLLAVLDGGYNLAIGSRFVKGGKNNLSLLRRIFTLGSCFVCRHIMGPADIGEFTNSSRAFTPELFERISLDQLPWREKSYIIQPAFLHEAVLAGAKYKEVPLIFKDREEGYSKNKVFNYTYDIVAYVIDARLRQMGINLQFFYLSRRAKTIVKFALVGAMGTMVDFIFYKLFISILGFPPATSKAFSAEIAIVNNFTLNNFWTFRYRKTSSNFWQKLGIFNLVSFGGLAIGVLIVKFLHSYFGDGSIEILGTRLAYNNFFFFATIPPVMAWNFIVNNLVTWKHTEVN